MPDPVYWAMIFVKNTATSQHFPLMRYVSLPILLLVLTLLACNRSPEELPKFKKKFQAQIASFEKEKLQTDKKVDDGVSTLNGLQTALDNAKNTDQEFNRVYGKWEAVSKQVKQLTKEYNDLKMDADNLFSAMERQTASINNEKSRGELQAAIESTKGDYQKTLGRTELAIKDLEKLYQEAYDVVKALEVAYALGEISNINEGLANIETRVKDIMSELTQTVVESKDLYDKKIQNI